MLHFFFNLFFHLRSQYKFLAFLLTLLVILAVLFFDEESLAAKLTVFLVIASLAGFSFWKLLRE